MSSLIPNLQSDVRRCDAPPSRLNNYVAVNTTATKRRVERSLEGTRFHRDGECCAMSSVCAPIAKIAMVLAGAVCLFTAENLWIEPKRSHQRLPSFVPEGLGGTWFLVLMVLGIALILAVLCQVLLMWTAGFAAWKKTVTGIAVLAATSLTCEWFVTTGGTRLAEQEGTRQKHKVVLKLEREQHQKRAL